jgi:hypothetical protein
MSSHSGELGLSEFIIALRNELAVAIEDGRSASIRFVPGPIDLELQIHAERKADAGGKIGFKLFGNEVGATAAGGLTSGNYQTLKMRLDIQQKPGSETAIKTKGVLPNE